MTREQRKNSRLMHNHAIALANDLRNDPVCAYAFGLKKGKKAEREFLKAFFTPKVVIDYQI